MVLSRLRVYSLLPDASISVSIVGLYFLASLLSGFS